MLKFIRRNEEGWKSIGLRWHQQPFANKGIEFIFHTPSLGDSAIPKHRFVLQIKWGPGAGYINGLTAFFAFRCKDRRHDSYKRAYVNIPIQFGITQNANIVPYPY